MAASDRNAICAPRECRARLRPYMGESLGLEHPKQFQHDDYDDNNSNDVEDVSVHAKVNTWRFTLLRVLSLSFRQKEPTGMAAKAGVL